LTQKRFSPYNPSIDGLAAKGVNKVAEGKMNAAQLEDWALEQMTVGETVNVADLKQAFRDAGNPDAIASLRRLEQRKLVEYRLSMNEDGSRSHTITRVK
jgi:hypothetical protein